MAVSMCGCGFSIGAVTNELSVGAWLTAKSVELMGSVVVVEGAAAAPTPEGAAIAGCSVVYAAIDGGMYAVML